MADRISSDHSSVQTVRATLAETTTGVRLEVPAENRDQIPVDEVVRVVLDGDELFAMPERQLGGEDVHIPGVYETPDIARDPRQGTDRLSAWRADENVRLGGSVLLDVVEPDFLYGVRSPGQTAFYDAREPPSDSLASIAKDLEEQ
ncbi:hypothetical protein OB955_16300 [Halobacteria archaeon AArc-m2/3/4]|uniref:Uncharacterized protein n=1 Tax=Natronoglomus mannanivorans TaxID=2979990 RepID=A0AAP2Z225_9EURY|nr:hypothetical protein [Halobacteria archaeon AArc-xg1-1]MCU4974288.1 hypothetical protein [Halobacteria archaeon AArc-m2/3/4]